MNECMLVVLTKVRYGGWLSFVSHLARSLEAQGTTVRILKAGARTENRYRDFGFGLHYQNLDAPTLVAATERHPTLIAVGGSSSDHELQAKLLAAGAKILIHDPTELKSQEFRATLLGHRPIAIREANRIGFERDFGLECDLAPHPYRRFQGLRTSPLSERSGHAVAFSRIDWDKNTSVIIEANEAVLPAEAVDIYGGVNRLYAHHKLEATWPGWEKKYYKGVFPRVLSAGANLSAGYRYAVDLSTIAGDGGGSQYTFLEAWDAEANLIVHEKWLQDGGELQPGVNCKTVGSAGELVELLRSAPDPSLAAGGLETLAQHSPKVTAPRWLELLGR